MGSENRKTLKFAKNHETRSRILNMQVEDISIHLLRPSFWPTLYIHQRVRTEKKYFNLDMVTCMYTTFNRHRIPEKSL